MNRDAIATHVYAGMLSSQQSGMTSDRLLSLATLAVKAADVLAEALKQPPGLALGGQQPQGHAGAGVGAAGPQPVMPALGPGWTPTGGVGGVPTGGLVQQQAWEMISPGGSAAGLGQPVQARQPPGPPPAEEALGEEVKDCGEVFCQAEGLAEVFGQSLGFQGGCLFEAPQLAGPRFELLGHDDNFAFSGMHEGRVTDEWQRF